MFDPLRSELPLVQGYCEPDSAELGRLRTGDLGRCESATFIGVRARGINSATQLPAKSELGLHRPLIVLTWRASIDGLLW